MSIQYVFNDDFPLLRVKASGKDDDLEDVQNYGIAIIQSAVSSGCTLVLCDETDLEYTLGTFDTYQAATFLAEHAPKISKTAIVCKLQHMSDAAFWETVAVNRGLQVKVFKSLQEAEGWLREN